MAVTIKKSISAAAALALPPIYLAVSWDQTVKGEETAHFPAGANVVFAASASTSTSTVVSGPFYTVPNTIHDVAYKVPATPERQMLGRADEQRILAALAGGPIAGLRLKV
jgi:hypothetical protein